MPTSLDFFQKQWHIGTLFLPPLAKKAVYWFLQESPPQIPRHSCWPSRATPPVTGDHPYSTGGSSVDIQRWSLDIHWRTAGRIGQTCGCGTIISGMAIHYVMYRLPSIAAILWLMMKFVQQLTCLTRPSQLSGLFDRWAVEHALRTLRAVWHGFKNLGFLGFLKKT